MRLSLRASAVVGIPLLGLALPALAQTFTPKSIVQFAQGGDKERAVLSRLPPLVPLIKGSFGIGAADLDGDGKNEIVVLSLACDAAGCPVVVLQNAAGRATPIFARKMPGRLALTNEKIGDYYALAAADPAGAIMTDKASGKQLVFAVGAAAPNTAGGGATPPAAARAAPAAPAAPATPTPAAPSSPPPAAVASAQGNGEFLPVCLLARCLNPRIVAKSGVGTDNAVADAKVTAEDAAAWCAKYNAGYKGCAEDQVAQGGTAGGAKFRANAFKASANCTAGKLTAVDGRSYTYAGPWPAGGPGAGRPKFVGTMGEIGGRVFAQQGEAQVANGSMSIFALALEPNAGESLAIQWETLCAGAPPPAAH